MCPTPIVGASSASTEPSSRTFTTQSAAPTFRSGARGRHMQRDAMDENTSQTTPGGALTPPQLQQHTAVAASAPRGNGV